MGRFKNKIFIKSSEKIKKIWNKVASDNDIENQIFSLIQIMSNKSLKCTLLYI